MMQCSQEEDDCELVDPSMKRTDEHKSCYRLRDSRPDEQAEVRGM